MEENAHYCHFYVYSIYVMGNVKVLEKENLGNESVRFAVYADDIV